MTSAATHRADLTATRSENALAADARGVSVESLEAGYGEGNVLRGVSLDVAAGRSVALLGPSGCGKTTLLRSIAGLVAPTAGRVLIGGHEMSRPGKVVTPEQRRVGMVFQDGALFPHMTVADNVAYGLDRRHRSGDRVAQMLDLVGLSGFADRSPTTLSGGQAQRIALARALAPHPSVLLLDEPFSSLDASMRVQVRTDVGRLLAEVGVTAIFVTHDQDEAFVLGEKVAVMRDGVIEQYGDPAALYTAPATPWVAAFVGEANLLPGRAEGDQATTALGRMPLATPATGAVQVMSRPEEIVVGPGDDAEVEVVEYYGHDTRYELRLSDGSLVGAREAEPPRHRRGDRVGVRYSGGPARSWPAT